MSPLYFDRVGKESAWLSAIEIGLGSVAHALHLPLTGQLLSLNQGFFLSRAVLNARTVPQARRLPFDISTVTALLKSLAPVGKKLMPMLAISVQGFLFSLGTFVAGPNIIGVVLGSVLSSTWAFLQPFLFFYLLWGASFPKLIGYLQGLVGSTSLSQSWLVILLAAMLFLKMLLAGGLALLAEHLPEELFQRYRQSLLRPNPRAFTPVSFHSATSMTSPFRGALSDLLSPWFVLSFFLMLSFLFFVESDRTQLVWYAARSVAVGFSFFFLVRWVPWERCMPYLEKSRWRYLAHSCRSALTYLKK